MSNFDWVAASKKHEKERKKRVKTNKKIQDKYKAASDENGKNEIVKNTGNVTDPYGFNKTKNSSDELYGAKKTVPKKSSVSSSKGQSTTITVDKTKKAEKYTQGKSSGIVRTSNIKSNSYNAKKDKEIKNKVFQVTGVDLNKKPQIGTPINKKNNIDSITGLDKNKYDKNKDGFVSAAEKKDIDNRNKKTMEDVLADRIIENRKRHGTPIDTTEEDKILSAVKEKNKDFTRDEAEQLYTRLKAENSSDNEVKAKIENKSKFFNRKIPLETENKADEERKINWEVYNERNYNKLSNSGKKAFKKLQEKNIPDNRNALEKELKEQGFDDYDTDNLINYATGNYVSGTYIAQQTEKFPVAMSAVSVGLNTVGSLPAMAEIATENIHNLVNNTDYNQKIKSGSYDNKRKEAYQYLNSAQYIRSKVAEKLSTSTNSDILNGVLPFLYQAGMSTADNLANRGLSGGSEALSLGLMGTNAGASRIAQGLEDGEDITSATIKGIAAGAIEIFTEKMGYDALKMFQNSGKTGFVNYAKDIIKEAIPEGFEEGTSDILNTTFEYLYDNMKAATNGDFSGLEKMPEYDLKEILLDAAAGAISGMTLSVGSTFARAQNTKITGLQLLDAGKQNLVFETADEYGIKTDTAKKKVKEFVKYCDSVVENDLADDNKVLRKYTKLESSLAKEVGSLNNILQENLNDTALKVYNEALKNPDIAVDLFGEKMEDKTKTPDSVFTDLVAKGYKTSKSSENGTDSNEVSGNKSNAVNNENTAPFNVIADNKLTPSAFIDYARNGGEQLPQVQNPNAENSQAQNGENVATDRSAASSDVFTRLIGNKQSGYATKMQADINEHSEDTHYVDNYKSLARVDEKGKVKVNGNTYTADEYSAEYNRIYDMGLDEETPTSEIKSKIFNAEQIRQIYAAAMVDDNIARYDGNMNYEQTVKKLKRIEEKQQGERTIEKSNKKNYNKNEVNNNERNTNAELLERGKISTVGKGEDTIRKSSNDTERVSGNLGNGRTTSKINGQEKRKRYDKSDWLGVRRTAFKKNNTQGKQPESGLSESYVRNLSRVKLKNTDTTGRKLNNKIKKKFADTVLKTEDGKLLSLYHWTDRNFKDFKYGDVGFHFGTYDAAEKRSKKGDSTSNSVFKEVYLNIKNPAIINYDPMTWNVFATSQKLAQLGVITQSELDTLEKIEDYQPKDVNSQDNIYNSKAAIELRKLLNKKGYDGIIYKNDFEGDYSVMAFYPEQIHTVAENDVDINSKEDEKASAFSNGEKIFRSMAGENTRPAIDRTDVVFSDSNVSYEKNLLTEYSKHQKENWKNSKSIVVYENEQQLEHFIDEVISGKNLNKKIYFGTVPESVSKVVYKKTGVNIKNYNISIKGYEIRKILLNSHGNKETESLRGQRKITANDIKTIPEIIVSADEVLLDSKLYQGKPVLKFIKTINGRTTVVTYTSNKHNDLSVQTMYSGKNKKGNLATATDALQNSNPLSFTPETTAGTVTFDTNISQNDNVVNSSISENSENDTKKAIKHQNTQKEWVAEQRNTDGKITDIPAPSEIVNTIRNLFNLPISKGKYKDKALGIYKTKAKTVRTRVSNSIPTIAHELGHHLDGKYNLSSLPSVNNADKVLEELKPGWLKQYNAEDRPFEIFAEFFREYLSDKQRAKNFFPALYNEFENAFDDKGKQSDFQKIQTVADMTNAYMASEQREQTKSVIVTRAEAKRRNKKAETLTKRKEKFIAKFQDEAIALKPLGNAYKQYWSAKQSDMRINSSITGDYLTGVDGNYAYKTDEKGNPILDENGEKIKQKSLAAILADLPDGKADKNFDDYLVKKHAVEWVREDKRVYADDTKNNLEFLNSEIEKYEKEFPKFKEISEELYEFQNEVMKEWLVKSGMMTYEEVDALKKQYPCYVPFNRDIGAEKNNQAKGSISNQKSPIKHAKGSGLDILNPIESIILNVEKNMKIGERNLVAQQITRFVDANEGYGYLLEKIEPDRAPNSISSFPVKEKVLEILRDRNINSYDYFSIDEALNKALGTDLTEWVVKDNQGRNVVFVSEKGEKQFYQVHDEQLLIALNGMSKPQLNAVIKFFAAGSRIMKSTTTGMNLFWSISSNLVRDFDSAYKYSKEKNLAVFTKDYIVAMFNAAKNSKTYKEYKAAGGGYSSKISNPKTLTTIFNQVYKSDKGKIKTFLENKVRLLEIIEGVSDVIEAGPRFAEYERVLKETGDKRAAVLAADEITVNFKRKGSKSSEIEAFFPYFNAGVQGVSKLVNTVADKNLNKTFIAKSVAMGIIIALLQFGWNKLFNDDDEYEKISAYKRNNFYNFSIGDGKFISIPKSKDTAILNSLFENIIFELTSDNHDFKDNMKDFGSYILDTFLPSGIPNVLEMDSLFGIPEQILSDTTFFGSVAEAMSNQNFMGAPIIPAQYEDLEGWSQYNEQTTYIARWLGKIFNFSPMKIDHIITSNLGMVGDLLKSYTAEQKNWSNGIKDWFQADNAYSNDIVNKFYDNYEKATKAKKTADFQNEENAGKKYSVAAQYEMYKQIANIINSYAKDDEENAREYKTLLRDYLNDFNLNIAENVDERLVELYNKTGNSEIFESANLTDEFKKDKKSYKISLDNYLKMIDDYKTQIKNNYNEILGDKTLSNDEKAEQLATAKETIVNELKELYAYQEKDNDFNSKIGSYVSSGVMKPSDYIKAVMLQKPDFADKNNDGKSDTDEKYNAIHNSEIPDDVKKLMQGVILMGSKKIDTDEDGAEDTKFSNLSPEKQEEYILEHSSDIDTILEDKKANAEKSEKKAEYRKALESKVNVFDYSQSRRKEVQKQIDSIASAQAGEEVNGDWEAKTVNNFIDFDNSGFIDISDYVKFKVYSKGYTKKAEQFEVINQLPGVDKKTKQKLKLYVAVRSKKFDADGDGKKEKYFTKFSSAWQEKYIKNNVGSIISNSKDWR